MRHIPPPEINAKRHFLNCISKVGSASKKRELTEIAPVIDNAAKEYKRLAKKSLLHSMKNRNCGISTKRLKRLYEYRMVNKKQPGRAVYDKIILSAPNRFCPFCAQRRVSSVDHFLCKSKFPELATIPNNLVPSCSDCNKTKDAYHPSKRAEQLLHPYFDNVKVRWLLAKIVKLNGKALLVFSVAKNTALSRVLVKRIENHFQIFELAELYSIHATGELRDIEHEHEIVRSHGGSKAAKEHLLAQAKSRERTNPNSWKTAAYFAMHDSKEFCSGLLKF